nr:hypothetical protein [Methanobrevibacter arboriphilus]
MKQNMDYLEFTVKNQTILIDKEDYELIRKSEKYNKTNLFKIDTLGYVKIGNKHLHRLIMNLKDREILVHHKNHDKLDNRKENLKLTNRKEHIKTHFPEPPNKKYYINHSDVVKYHSKGLNDSQIAEKLNCRREVIFNIRKELSLKKVSNKKIEFKLYLKKLFLKYWSVKKVADVVKLNESTILRHLNEVGIKNIKKTSRIDLLHRDEEMINLYEEYNNFEKVDDFLGLTNGTTYHRIHDKGLI